MNDYQVSLVFMFVSKAMNTFVDGLQPVPLQYLKDWLRTIKEVEVETPGGIAMRQFHTDVIEAYIKAREYAQNDRIDNIKNN